MDTLEVVDPTVGPWTDETIFSNAYLFHCRPLQSEADWIAAAAPAGEVEIRYMLDDLPDDAYERAHERGTCSTCSDEPGEYVLPEKRSDTETMQEYGVKWDPTITF